MSSSQLMNSNLFQRGQPATRKDVNGWNMSLMATGCNWNIWDIEVGGIAVHDHTEYPVVKICRVNPGFHWISWMRNSYVTDFNGHVKHLKTWSTCFNEVSI